MTQITLPACVYIIEETGKRNVILWQPETYYLLETQLLKLFVTLHRITL